MPLFDYQCHACGRVFEELVRDTHKVACPDCDASDPERLMAVPARPARQNGGGFPDLSRLGPPPGGGCCGGGCAH
jgi:putative FmdB family regulatory protein